jgi:6-phospho-beta-glucosidase
VQREVARRLGVDPGRLWVDQVGLNHLTWVRALWLDGEDVLDRVLSELGDELAASQGLPGRLLHELHAIPSYYLRYFYAEADVLGEQLSGEPPRAQVVADIERELLELYRDPSLDEKPALLEQRGGAFYSEAATQLIASLSAGTGDVQVVDVRNGGTLAGLQADDVVEVPARIGAAGAEPVEQRPLAPELLGLTQHVAAYERLTAEAAVTRERVTARKALLTNPLVREYAKAEELVDELLAEHPEAVTR